MIVPLSIIDFLNASKEGLILDVRTPDEFNHSHIENAFNLPLFSNEERALVGTCFKQKGRQAAILLGFELIGGRWADYIRTVSTLVQTHLAEKERPKLFIHCWRGGMRSGAMAWALNLYGFDVFLLKGGYKSYRKYCLEILEKPYPIIILSGKTGSAKTETLLEMGQLGEQVIDLEGLANHQGSSFGSMGRETQPSQEQFENMLAIELMKMDLHKRIWLENESKLIGIRIIPATLFSQMRATQIINMHVPDAERIKFLLSTYGKLNSEFLKTCVIKISKRLGPNETKLSLQAIDENRMDVFIKQVLVYYDKTYQKGQTERHPSSIHELELDSIDFKKNAEALINYCHQLFGQSVDQFIQPLKPAAQSAS